MFARPGASHHACLFPSILTICLGVPNPPSAPVFFARTYTQIVALRTRFKESGPGANGVQLEQGLTLMLSSREELNKFAATRDELGALCGQSSRVEYVYL
jgi:hypothetical protein